MTKLALGFHLCYGDFGGKHFFDPVTARHLVDISNAVAGAVRHKLAYIHLPVPLPRATDEFFEPMRDFRLAPETEIYLGLVHVADGVEGTRKRIELARKYVPKFGVSTESASRVPASLLWCSACSPFTPM
jgi:hypothetical protein